MLVTYIFYVFQVKQLLTSVVAVVNSFVHDLRWRDQFQERRSSKPTEGLGFCSADPLSTDVALIMSTTLVFVCFIIGLPYACLQLRDMITRYNVKKSSRELRLKHEAENLRDLRYLSNRAVEENLTLRVESTPSGPWSPRPVPPPIAKKPEGYKPLHRVERAEDLEALGTSGGGITYQDSESVRTFKAAQKALAEEALKVTKERAGAMQADKKAE